MTRLRPLLLALIAAAALAAPATASADFGFLGDWGTTGDQNGQFRGPTHVAVAPDGSVWVADEEKRVQKFTPDGQYLTHVEIGMFGAGPIATDGAGNLYVGNTETTQIQKFDPNGNPLGTFGGPGDKAGQFQYICVVGADAAGNFYVSDGRGGYCDTTPRVQKFDGAGNLVKEIKLGAKGQPEGVGDIAVDGAGNIFVADDTNFGNSEIFKLSPDGAVAARFGSQGAGPGQFARGGPQAIALAPDGTIYAVDAGNHRVQHLTADGSFLGQFGAANAFYSVAVAPNADVYVTRGRQSVPTQENAGDVGVDRVMHFGQNAPPASPSPLALTPSAKITLGTALTKKCGLKDPGTGKPIKNCTGMREATIGWAAGCPAQGALVRRSVEVSLGDYELVSPGRIEPVTGNADSGSVKVVLWPGSKVTPQIDASCVAYTQPDGEPVVAKGSAKGNTVKTAPVAYAVYMEYSRSARGRLLGNYKGKKIKGASIKVGKEVRFFWGARYDASLGRGNKSIKIHIKGAGMNVTDYLHAFHLEAFGPRLLIKTKKRGQFKVWVTIDGVRSSNTLTFRAV